VSRPAPPRLPASALAAVVLLVGTLVGVLPPAGPARADDADATTTTPLAVSIATLAPGTIPRRGRVTVTGRVTNRSADTWRDLNVYLLTSPEPLRTSRQLADAAATDADAPVGVRRTGAGLFDQVGDLAPGDSASYRLSVRRQDLGISGVPGVYWVGVHVLGEDPDGRVSVADGRARTFMPLLPAPGSQAGARARTSLALLVPVKRPVQRGSAGRLTDLPRWNRVLRTDGRLDRLLRLSGQARRPLTWVVDPALLEAVSSVAAGNPPLDPVADPDQGAGPSASASPSSGSSGSAGATPSGSPTTGTGSGTGTDTDPAADTAAARAWLAEFRRQSTRHSIAALPYGDLDVAAALGSPLSSIYAQGVELGAASLKRLGISGAQSVVDPDTGYLPAQALDAVDPRTPVVLTGAAVPSAAGPALDQDAGAPIVLTDPDAAAGGPEPSSRLSALAVRQRLLSEAAVHALSADRDQPLVVQLPPYWDPGPDWADARFFRGLDQPWLQLVDLPTVVSGATRAAGGVVASTAYPESERRAQVPETNLAVTRDLTDAGKVFARLLTRDDTVDQVLARMAMLASSLPARRDPGLARYLTRGATEHVRAQLAEVRVEGPEFVMMSGESGPIQVTLVNHLPQSVTVGLRISTPGSSLRIDGVRPVTLGPGRRTSVRLQARSHDIGVHAVTLATTDSRGVPLGPTTQFSVRTSHVSTVIWVLMAVGGALLLVAIVVRLVRRVRVRKATHGPLLPRETDA
jgi:hypothetical protein